MPKQVVPLVTGEYYHVYNRGVDKRVIFLDKHDYLRFYRSFGVFNAEQPVQHFRLGANKPYNHDESLVEIIAYSLLPNHFHMIVKQRVRNGLSEFMKRLSVGYTGYFNEKNDRSGVLFQGAYKRVHVKSDEQFKYLFAYVNENHLVHGLKREPEIIYSSSLHYQGKLSSKVINFKTEYNHIEALQLAKQIYEKRKKASHLLE